MTSEEKDTEETIRAWATCGTAGRKLWEREEEGKGDWDANFCKGSIWHRDGQQLGEEKAWSLCLHYEWTLNRFGDWKSFILNIGCLGELWDGTELGERQVQVLREECGSFVRSLFETAPTSLGCAQSFSRARSKTRTKGGETLSQAFILLWYESKSFSEAFWLKVMLTQAPIADLPVCFQTVCEERNIFSSLLHCQTGRQEWNRVAD